MRLSLCKHQIVYYLFEAELALLKKKQVELIKHWEHEKIDPKSITKTVYDYEGCDI